MTAKTISCVIPCFNNDSEIQFMTEQAVESIRRACPEAEIIIIDNGSTFGAAYLREVADIYIRNTHNIGYPAAVNQGIKLSHGEIICVSNNDIRVPENIFDVGLDILKDLKIGSVHFKMIPYDAPFTFGENMWKTSKERWCTSSFYLIKREALPDGLYDENYGAGGYDDWDFWMRVRHINGWITAYTNRSCYQHFGSWTLSKIPESEKSQTNREYFKKKYGEYAEEIWNRLYPSQMRADYQRGFE